MSEAKPTQNLIDGPVGLIEVKTYGEGPPVVLIPSLGRGASDFDLLSRRLAGAGYHAIAQGAATVAQPVKYWWKAGGKDIFIVQPTDDVMAVPENAVRLCEELGDRASMVMVPDAGHALLPEQPEAVALAVLSWLNKRNTQ